MATVPRWIRTLFTGAALVAVGSIAVSFSNSPSWAQGDTHLENKVAPGGVPGNAQVERGRYIATAADCVACHTAPGGQAFAGGLALKTPFGTLASSNITSDRQTGIGGWTEQQFEAALRKGIGRDGHLYPAMPYTAYTRMTDADVADLWAYMRTVAPVSHAVTENQLPFPLNIRALMIAWNALFFDEGRFRPDPGQPAEVNRGAYLAEALEHCGTCHTPRNLFGANKTSEALQGATLQGWHAPDLTNNAHTGLASWTSADIVAYLKTANNRTSAASGPMGEAVVNSTQHLSDQDLAALAAWLKAMPEREVAVPAPLAADDPRMADGKHVFEANCVACHVSSGQGIAGMIPTLAANPAVRAEDPASLLHVLLKGTQGTATNGNPTAAGMPRFDWKLDDAQIADVISYVRNSWGNAAPAVTPGSVAKARRATDGQVALQTAR